MSKKCSKCDKAVYPAEEFKCLDKTWHKACFKCWDCGMQLTMKNYKGYNKLPYCSAHYPQMKATTVAETPEQRRLKEITKMNSQVEYQADYQKNMVGKVTSVADDPETMRVRNLGNVMGANYNSERESMGYTKPTRSADEDEPQQPRSYMPSQPVSHQPPPPPPTSHGGSSGVVFVAQYDYEAQDGDEVSFSEGDRIVDCEVIDDGWITGTVESTGQRGMIPANYVEAQ